MPRISPSYLTCQETESWNDATPTRRVGICKHRGVNIACMSSPGESFERHSTLMDLKSLCGGGPVRIVQSRGPCSTEYSVRRTPLSQAPGSILLLLVLRICKQMATCIADVHSHFDPHSGLMPTNVDIPGRYFSKDALLDQHPLCLTRS